ncbi:MAG: autotransporter assembly complex family protein [Halioglobus sp.]
MLTYSVRGIDDELTKNVLGWLGSEPETPEERSNFIAAAEDKTASALEAMGYYQPDISIALDKAVIPWKMQIQVSPNEQVVITEIDFQLTGEAAQIPELDNPLIELPFAEGSALDHGVYEAFKKTLIATGLKLGYFDSEILLSRVEVNIADATARVQIHYDSGPRYRFGEISFDESFIDKKLFAGLITFQVGDFFDLTLLQTLRAELQQTRYFSSVTVRPRRDALENGLVPIDVVVTPTYRHGFDFGVGFSTDTGERISVTWRTPVLNRYGHSQESRYEYSPDTPRGRFIYNIPLTHPLNDALQLSAYLEEREYGDLDSLQKGVGARREIKRGSFIYSYSARTLDEAWTVGRDHRSNSYVLPGLSLSHKTRSGSIVDPESGFAQVYLFETGAEEVGSDINLARIYSNYRMVVPLATDHRLVARAELGAVFLDQDDRSDLAPSLSFFTGGSQSIRGFSYQSIGTKKVVEAPDGSVRTVVVGGDRLLVASAEYQYYVNQNWRASTFLDFGDAFDGSDFDAHYGAGFGVHFLSPVGALRLEIARDISEDDPDWRLHFNIGAEF